MNQDMDDELEILGQPPSVAVYINICLCFPIADDTSSAEIVTKLSRGFERLTASFPWLTGEVINEGAAEGHSGIFKIKRSHDKHRLISKDYRADPAVPSIETLRQFNFPVNLLDERLFCARRVIPMIDVSFITKPVLLIQASFIKGGLIISFTGHHQAMDGTGQGLLMDLFDKACRKEAFTSEELLAGNAFRRDVIPRLEQSVDGSSTLNLDERHGDVSFLRPKGAPPIDVTTTTPCTWVNVAFNGDSVAAIKRTAMQHVTNEKGFISTDDAMTAFLWQSIVRARTPRLQSSAKTTLARAVNVRGFLGVSEKCTGAIQNISHHKHTIEEIVEQPFGAIAVQLRAALVPETSKLGQETRELTSFLQRTPDKSVVIYGANIEPSTDLKVTSWAKLNSYDLDFGLGLGKPEVVRTPLWTCLEGLVILLPKTHEGAWDVSLCLSNEDLKVLKEDKAFMKYVKWIG